MMLNTARARAGLSPGRGEPGSPAITHVSLITAGFPGALRQPVAVRRDDHAGDNVARRAAGGAVWSALAFGAGKALGFATNIILARLLTPGDFGLVSFAMVLIGAFTLLQDLGVGSALVYSRADIRQIGGTALTINLLMALALFALTLAGSVAMAWLSGAAITQPIVVILALGLIVTAAGSVQTALLTRDLAFRRKFLPDVVPLIVSGVVAVALALLGFGVWSLVASYLAKSVATTALLWWLSPYRPRPQFDLRVARELLGYGRHVSLSSVIGFGVMNVDYFIVGHMLGSRALGTYTLAFMIGTLPSTLIAQQIAAATFPALSRLRGQPAELARLFGQAFTISGVLATALGGAIFVGMPVLVGPVLGAKWLPMIEPLRLLTIFGVLRALEFAFSPFYRAIGRPQIMWLASLLRLCLLTPVLLWVVRSGINGVALAQIAIAAPLIPLNLAIVARILDLRGRPLRQLIGPQGLGAAVLAAILAAGTFAPPLAPLTRSLIGAAVLTLVAVAAHLAAVAWSSPALRAVALAGIRRGRA